MVQELSYSTIMTVTDSWDALKRTKDYERTAGGRLFQHLFDKCPRAKALFGFPINVDVNSPDLMRSKRFLAHAAYLLEMIDTAINMLGPDIELLTEIMSELGKKHLTFGVQPEMFPIMGDGLLLAMRENLSAEDFNEDTEVAWKAVYRELSGDMIRSMVSK